MSVSSGQTISVTFTAQDPTTGALANATGTPAGTLKVNGVDNAATVTVATTAATGVYKATVTMPTMVSRDFVELLITGTVAGVAGGGIVWRDFVDPVLKIIQSHDQQC